jgi:hypothetical protein
LGPSPHNLNLFLIKPNKTIFCWTSDDWVFFFRKNYDKPNYKKPSCVNFAMYANSSVDCRVLEKQENTMVLFAQIGFLHEN